MIDQGYYFEVIEELPYMHNPQEKEKLMMSTLKEQVELLTQILQSDESKLEREEEGFDVEEDDDLIEIEKEFVKSRQKERPLGAFTGADSAIYDEYSKH